MGDNTMIAKRAKLAARVSSLACAAAFAASSSALFAQVSVPPTREEVERDSPIGEDAAVNPALSLDSDLTRASCPLGDSQFDGITFDLKAVEFSGVEVLDPDILAPSWTWLEGQEIPIARVCDIRDRAAAILSGLGYVATVQVPPQTIEDGTVKLDVVVARLSGLVIRGEPGTSGTVLESYFEALQAEPYFNSKQAERLLLLARDIPGMDVRLALTRDTGPNARPGDLIGIVDVLFRRFEGDIGALNWSSKSVGRFGGTFRGQVNGLTGLADLTELTVYSTFDPEEQIVLQGRHEFGLGSDGLRLGASVVHAWTQPDVPGDDVFDATTFVASVYGKYPLLRTQGTSIGLEAGFEWIDQDLEFSGLPLTEDEIRAVYLKLETSSIDAATLAGLPGYSLAEPRLATRGRLDIRQGLGFLGASDDCGAGFLDCFAPGVVPIARLDADPTGFLIRGEGQVDFRPTPLFTISAKPRFQVSPDPLLAYEQFSGGNYTAGRGYDPGAVIGDSGVGSQLEFAYGTLYSDDPKAIAWQPFVFFDTFAAWTKNIPGDPVTLTSIGGGVRASIARRAFLEVVGAVPLERTPFQTRRGDTRLLVNMVVRLGQ